MSFDDVVWKYPKALIYRLVVKSKRYKNGNYDDDGNLSIDDDGYLELADSDDMDDLKKKLERMAKR